MEREERAEESQRHLASRDTPDVLLETDDLRPARPEVTEVWQWPTVAPPDPSEVRSWVATHQGARQRPAANFNSQGGETEDEQSGGLY
uniref:Uncharacterized protein n=1 Tax=Plectus sambesii TaxID=2011161 RepID=A0A914VTU1_9BILA